MQDFKNKNLELKSVEIIRINQLRNFMAALIEKIAKNDPDHLRIFYGCTISAKVDQATSTISLNSKSCRAIQKKSNRLVAISVLLPEGAGTKIAQELGLKTKTISEKLHGSTVALRLPHGFDITLRPIENFEGTASVKGVAKIDPEKLTLPGQPIVGAHSGKKYNWTMIGEQELCKELTKSSLKQRLKLIRLKRCSLALRHQERELRCPMEHAKWR